MIGIGITVLSVAVPVVLALVTALSGVGRRIAASESFAWSPR